MLAGLEPVREAIVRCEGCLEIPDSQRCGGPIKLLNQIAGIGNNQVSKLRNYQLKTTADLVGPSCIVKTDRLFLD